MRHLFRLFLLLSALVAACAVAPAAFGDSLVYLKDGNVWLTSPDGAKQYQVTFDGHWDSPSQADDGTIVAAQGTNLVHMDRSGRVISTVPGLGGATSTLLGDKFKAYGPWDPEVSPDGKHIAYDVSMYNPWSTSDTINMEFDDAVVVTSTDHFDVEPSKSWTTSVKQPTWVSNDRTLVAGTGLGSYTFQTWIAGGGNDSVQWWFHYPDAIESDPALSPDGHKLVAVAQTGGALSASDTLQFFAIPGPAWTDPPYVDTWKDDAVRPPAGTISCQNRRDSEAHSPTWSPRSDAIAYDDKDGIWIQQVPDLGDGCAARNERLLVPGGAHPDWGPADVDMSQKPAPPGSAPAPAPAAVPKPAPAAGATSVLRIGVPARAGRRAGVAVRVTLSAPAPVTVTVCHLRHGRCTGRSARRSVQAGAGTTRIVVPVRRLRRGRYAVVVQAAGAAPVVRSVRLS